jgi:hypothetical protein
MTGNEGHLDGERQILKGEDFVQYFEQLKMNPSYAKELSPIFMTLKEEVLKEMSAEDFLTIAPQVLNESLKNVNTDIGKGKLMDLGLTVMMNPVTSIEEIEIVAANKKNKLENVNKMLEDERGIY